MNSGAWITVASVLLLLASKRREWRVGEWIFKPIASTGFIASAIQHGSLSTAYGAGITAGLVLSWWGDVLLIPKSRRAFLGGLVAFLLAHVAYACAFIARGVQAPVAAGSFVLLLMPLAFVARWLIPHVPGAMKPPVAAYMLVITVMVALSLGTAAWTPDTSIVVGAVAFYLSDLSVARDRFVTPGFDNKLWGWPLYYGAQLVLAATTATR